MASQSGRPWLESSLLWKPEILHKLPVWATAEVCLQCLALCQPWLVCWWCMQLAPWTKLNQGYCLPHYSFITIVANVWNFLLFTLYWLGSAVLRKCTVHSLLTIWCYKLHYVLMMLPVLRLHTGWLCGNTVVVSLSVCKQQSSCTLLQISLLKLTVTLTQI